MTVWLRIMKLLFSCPSNLPLEIGRQPRHPGASVPEMRLLRSPKFPITDLPSTFDNTAVQKAVRKDPATNTQTSTLLHSIPHDCVVPPVKPEEVYILQT